MSGETGQQGDAVKEAIGRCVESREEAGRFFREHGIDRGGVRRAAERARGGRNAMAFEALRRMMEEACAPPPPREESGAVGAITVPRGGIIV